MDWRKVLIGAVVVLGAVAVIGFGRPTSSGGNSDSLTSGVPTSTPSSSDPTPSAVAMSPSSAPSSASGDPIRTLHYISNTGTDIAPVARLGFNLFDLPPSKSVIDALGPGQQALVWLGNLDNTNCTPGYSWSSFQSHVRQLAHDPKVFGYFISDEPHPGTCPNAVKDIRQRADFIRAQNPQQKSFIVVMDAERICGADMGCEYSAVNESTTHVDYIGIDPFPCSLGTGLCDPAKIDLEVQRAEAAGISQSTIVPVFQVFGQECSTITNTYYKIPTATELSTMLAEWHRLVPDPAFDFTYTWRSGGPACPSLDRATGSEYSNLQAVIEKHNAG